MKINWIKQKPLKKLKSVLLCGDCLQLLLVHDTLLFKPIQHTLSVLATIGHSIYASTETLFLLKQNMYEGNASIYVELMYTMRLGIFTDEQRKCKTYNWVITLEYCKKKMNFQ